MIHKGLRVYLSDVNAPSSETMISTVLAVETPDYITLAIPESSNSKLTPGSDIEVFFYNEDTRYSFRTEVTGRLYCDNRLALLCRAPRGELEQDRRSYFRTDTIFPVCIALALQEKHIVLDRFNAFCTNISGGGMKVSMPAPYHFIHAKQSVDIDFVEALGGLTTAKGITVRELSGHSDISICFTEINKTDRDRIIHYVHKRAHKHTYGA